MLVRCNPQKVQEVYLQARSWRKAAEILNCAYGVRLSHTAWADYAKGKHDIADPETRSRLMLPPRPCPYCGRKDTVRKQNQQSQIRTYGYPAQKNKSFLEVLSTREAPR